MSKTKETKEEKEARLHGCGRFNQGDSYTTDAGEALKMYSKGQLLVPLGIANDRIDMAREYQRQLDIKKEREADGTGSWQEAVAALETEKEIEDDPEVKEFMDERAPEGFTSFNANTQIEDRTPSKRKHDEKKLRA